jgi:hypothetical protein
MMCSREVNTTFPMATHSLFIDRLAYNSECLRANITVRHEVVRVIEIELVDLALRYELVDLSRAFALKRDRFELFRIDLQILAFADFVAFDDVAGFDFIAGLGIDLPVFDPIAGTFIDLMEADLLSRSDDAG